MVEKLYAVLKLHEDHKARPSEESRERVAKIADAIANGGGPKDFIKRFRSIAARIRKDRYTLDDVAELEQHDVLPEHVIANLQLSARR